MARLRPAGGSAPATPPAGSARHNNSVHTPDEPPLDQDHGPDADPVSTARTICLRLLTMRARTRSELAEALAAREVPEAAANHVLERLASVGLIDDVTFAADFTVAKHGERGLAAREIARQLRAKGVDDSIVSAAVEGLDAETETQTARRLVQRKLKSMSRLEPAVQTRRLVAMLARKGYSPTMAFQVVRGEVGSHSDEVADDAAAWLA